MQLLRRPHTNSFHSTRSHKISIRCDAEMIAVFSLDSFVLFVWYLVLLCRVLLCIVFHWFGMFFVTFCHISSQTILLLLLIEKYTCCFYCHNRVLCLIVSPKPCPISDAYEFINSSTWYTKSYILRLLYDCLHWIQLNWIKTSVQSMSEKII